MFGTRKVKSKKWRRRELGPFVTTGADFSFCIYWGDFSGAKGVARECTGCMCTHGENEKMGLI